MASTSRGPYLTAQAVLPVGKWEKALMTSTRKLARTTDPFEQQVIAEDIQHKCVQWYRCGQPQFTDLQDLHLIKAVTTTAAPLLDNCLPQGQDWTQPCNAVMLNTASLLLNGISSLLKSKRSRHDRHGNGCSCAPVLPALQSSGLIAVLAAACGRASTALTSQPDAALYWVFTQYLSTLLQVWTDIFKTVPEANELVLSLDGSSPLKPLLLPGAKLSATCLQRYAGPDAAAVFSSTGRVHGYHVTSTFGPHNINFEAEAALLNDKAGWIMAAGVAAQSLRVAGLLCSCCSNAYDRIQTCIHTGTESSQTQAAFMDSSTGQVLESPDILQLVQTVLFVEAKKLYDAQAGKAAAAAPRTSRSGRPIEGTANPDKTHSRKHARVPPHHIALGRAIGLDYLLLGGNELFQAVTAPGSTPLPGFSRLWLSTYDIGTVVNHGVAGLLAVLCGMYDRAAFKNTQFAAEVQFVGTPSDPRPNVLAMPTQVLLLTLVELCVLASNNVRREDIAIDLMLQAMCRLQDILQDSFVAQKGLSAFSNFTKRWSAGPAWHSGPNHLDDPALQDLIHPVLQDAVVLLAPVLLPGCHLAQLPSEVQAAEQVLSPSNLTSGQLTQQLLTLAASAGRAS